MAALIERIEIIDVTDEGGFARIPPCADPGFDHRSCDYWEDADRGSKAARLDWLSGDAGAGRTAASAPPRAPSNPFLADLEGLGRPSANPFLDDDPGDALAENPFAPRRAPRPTVGDAAPRKLRLLGRGLGVAGSYAKVLLLDGEPAVYCQFGPLTAYPRAQRTRDLYPALPEAPLPATITCIATTADARDLYPALPEAPLPATITCIATTTDARDLGLARHLIRAVCDDLAARGFAAVETYPEVGARADATSAATPAFWESVGFTVAAPDDRFPVMRLELG